MPYPGNPDDYSYSDFSSAPAPPAYKWEGLDDTGWTNAQRQYQDWTKDQMAQARAGQGQATKQYLEGQQQAAGNLYATASGRGANPAAEQAAIGQGSNMRGRGLADVAALNAQQAQMAGQLYQQSMAEGAQRQMDYAQTQQALDEAAAQHWAAMATQGASAGQQSSNSTAGWIGAILGAISDERLKTGIAAPAPAQEDAAMRALQAYRYRYAPVARTAYGAPPGPQVGVMAQDLERSPVTAPIVSRDPNGVRRIDTTQAATTALGLVGRLAERVDQLEGRKLAHRPHGNEGEKV